MSFQRNKQLDVMKAIAVFSVICAHCAALNSDASRISVVISNLLVIMGTIGVGVFFVISGFLMSYSKASYKDYCLSRVRALLPSWFFTGTIVFLYITLRKGNLTMYGYLRWIFGVGTYLWYMPVLLVLHFILFPLRHKEIIIVLMCLVSIISVLITSIGLSLVPY